MTVAPWITQKFLWCHTGKTGENHPLGFQEKLFMGRCLTKDTLLQNLLMGPVREAAGCPVLLKPAMRAVCTARVEH